MPFLRFFIFLFTLYFYSSSISGQGFSFNCTRDTLLPGCPAISCFNLKAIVPDIHGLTDSYTINSLSGFGVQACSPTYVFPNDPGTSANLNSDDFYSAVINIGFPFPFYGTVYNNLIASTNGVISFDISKAGAPAHWSILNATIPQDLPSTFYDKALIMGPYHDLDPSSPTSPSQLIQYTTVGAAPFRKWVLSYYRVPLYGNAICNSLIENTYQIILFESTGIVEVKIFDKQICNNWNQGRAMIGIQNFNRDNGVMPAGRRASDAPWGNMGMNESWRFIPSAGPTLFRRVELYTLGGIFITTGTTTALGNGSLEAIFPNICPPAGATTRYIVKSFYTKIDDPAVEIFGTDTLQVTRSANLISTLSTTSASCSAATGTITATNTSGGTPPYQFSLDGVVWQSLNIFTGLASGNYNIRIRDASVTCTANYPVTISISGLITATTISTPTSCAGVNNGVITVSPTSGAGPFSFSLNSGPPQASNVFNNLAPGLYSILVRDITTGCTSSLIQVTVDTGAVITATATPSNVLCNGGNTGSITVSNLTPGTAPFEYSLNGTIWQTSPTFNGLTAGMYTVFFREANGCQSSMIVTVSEPSILLSSSSLVPVVCYSQNNGRINISATGGVAPYQYSLNGAAFQSSNSFNVTAGNYIVTIRDTNGCMSTQNISMTEPLPIVATAVTLTASCDGGNDGRITASATGGNSSYQYSIDGSNYQASTIFNVSPGIYSVIAKDNLNCTDTATNIIVALSSNLTHTPLPDQIICEGSSTPINFVSNATNYSWSPPVGLSNTNTAATIANPTTSQQYIISYTLGRCTEEDTMLLNINAAPIPDAGPDGLICYGQSYQMQANGGVVYNWTPATFLSGTNSASPTATPNNTMTYTMRIITDLNGCPSLTTDQMTINVTPPIKVKTFPKDTVVYAGDLFQLNSVSIANIYNWSPSFDLNNPTIPNPFITVNNDVTYTVTASTVAGCKGEGYINIRVYKGPDLYFPTAFTPNGDGLNDDFKPFPVGIEKLNYFHVFNRWGQMIFSTSSLYRGWDGTINGVKQASGTFPWIIQGITKDGKLVTKKGTVVLVR